MSLLNACVSEALNLVIKTFPVFQGIILASKVNWRDDPKLKDIAMGLENIPN